jgi:Terminase large subunit, T4likevirus-type, N-terminal
MGGPVVAEQRPRNSKRRKAEAAFQNAAVTAENLTVGEQPKPTAPGLIVVKTLQEALLAGEHSPAQFARDFLDVEPYPAQAEVLDAFHDARQANFSAGNRVGKTFASGVWLLWKSFYRHSPSASDGMLRTQWQTYKAVNTSLTFEQAKLAFTYALNFAQSSKRFKPFFVDAIHSPFPIMTLRTRNEAGTDWVPSEIHARSLAKNGLYLLGMSINHVQIDECAYVPKYKQIEDVVLLMRLADTGGSLFRISTPNGRNQFFDYYQAGRKGDKNIVSRTLTSWDNPYTDKAYLRDLKKSMLPEMYAQNVMGDFISLSDFFPIDTIERLYTRQTKDGPEPIEYDLPVPPKRSGAIYVMGVDLGQVNDPTVCIVWRIDTQPFQMVYAGEVRGKGWEDGKQFAKSVWEMYTPAMTAVDATGGGGHVAEQLVDELENIIPFVFSSVSKPLILTAIQQAAQNRRFVFPLNSSTQTLVQQMSFYRLDDKGIKQDYVMCLALVNHARETFEQRGYMQTELYEDLSFIDVIHGGELVGGVDLGHGPGTLFTMDARTGLFIPDMGGLNGDDF